MSIGTLQLRLMPDWTDRLPSNIHVWWTIQFSHDWKSSGSYFPPTCGEDMKRLLPLTRGAIKRQFYVSQCLAGVVLPSSHLSIKPTLPWLLRLAAAGEPFRSASGHVSWISFMKRWYSDCVYFAGTPSSTRLLVGINYVFNSGLNSYSLSPWNAIMACCGWLLIESKHTQLRATFELITNWSDYTLRPAAAASGVE